MKNKITFICLRLFFATILLGSVSCETEPLIDPSQQIFDQNTSKSSSKKENQSLDFSANCDVSNKTDLYAGQNILVGDVSVSVDGDNYIITYNITNNDYCLKSTHLSVVTDPQYFPMGGGGNPKNGHFEYSNSHDCVSSYSYTVPTSKGSYIAAHGVVNCKINDGNSEIQIPTETLDICVNAIGTGAGGDSYFDISINNSKLEGDYNAWCVDFDIDITSQCFNFDAYTSYDENLPNVAIDKPENIGAVNWLLNQNFIGQPSSGGYGNYTYGDIQIAIWQLLESYSATTAYTGPTNTYRYWELRDMALEHNDFVPTCDELMAIVLIPDPLETQSMIITLPFPCGEVGDCEETVWGDGCDFPGNNWATYFHYSN